MQVVGLLLLDREQGPEVRQFRVGGLGVVHRKGLGRIGPGFVRIVERHSVLALPVEPVVVLDRGSCNSQPASVHVLSEERIVIEAVVVVGVRFLDMHLVEFAVVGPLDYPLELHRVSQGEGGEDPRSAFPDAVPDGFEAVLQVGYAVRDVLLDLFLLLEVVFLALRLGESVVPCVERRLLADGGIEIVQGVQPRPVDRIPGGAERIPYLHVGQGIQEGDVILVAERIYVLQGVRREYGVAGGQLRNRVNRGEEGGCVVGAPPGTAAQELVPVVDSVLGGIRGHEPESRIAWAQARAHADSLECDHAHHDQWKPYSLQCLLHSI